MRIHRSAPPIVFAIALLAACGGPASAPAKPSATGVSPDFVARGETFTVTGTGFGTSGTVTVGGVVASVSSWSDTAIEATVPAAAPGAWQEVEVTTAGGSSKVAGPFVGVAYEGDAADLPDFLASQSPGTAVMLAAEEYDLTGLVRLDVDNVDLYGRGEGETTLTMDALGRFHVYTSPGRTVKVSGLKLRAGRVSYSVRDRADVQLASLADLEAALVAPQAIETAGVTFDEVTIVPFGAGSTVGPSAWTAPNLDLVLRDVFIDAGYATIMLDVFGDLTIESSRVYGGDPAGGPVRVAAFGGVLTVVDSDVISLGGLVVGADRGVEVESSLLRAVDGDLAVNGAIATTEGATIVGGGPVVVSGSRVQALDADLDDADLLGALTFESQHAPVRLAGNELIRSYQGTTVKSVAANGEGDLTIVGNAEVRVGVFESEAPGHGNNVTLSLELSYGDVASEVVIEDNAITVTGPLSFSVPTAVDVHVNRNALTLGDDGGPGGVLLDLPGGRVWMAENVVTSSVFGVMAMGGEGTSLDLRDNTFEMKDMALFGLAIIDFAEVEVHGNEVTLTGTTSGLAFGVQASSGPAVANVTGNTFTGFERALLFQDATPAVGIAAKVNHNVFDVVIDAPGKAVELVDVKDVIDAKNNRWGDLDDAATVMSYVLLSGATEGRGGGIVVEPIIMP